MPRDEPGMAGFTLLETLIAMTVLALLASVLLRCVVSVRSDAIWFDDHKARALLAATVLDEAIGNRRLHDGTYRGRQGGRHWVLTAASAEDAAAAPLDDVDHSGAGVPALNWRPQRLVVRVEAPHRPVVLETVRLAAP